MIVIRSANSPLKLRPRRGFGLIELSVTSVLLATMVLITLQLVGWVVRDRQSIGRREAATRLVASVMERCLARPWAEISTAALVPVANVMAAGRSPNAGSLRIEVTPADPIDGHGQKKILVAITWPTGLDGPGAPVQLIAWTTEAGDMHP